MKVSIRPHHFLCIKGYKGSNYSESQAAIWNKFAQVLRENPETDIFVKYENDDLCHNCPAKFSKNDIICRKDSVKELDNKIAVFLNLKEGVNYKYSEILEKLKSMTAKKHEQLCSSCYWWNKGFCRDSFVNK